MAKIAVIGSGIVGQATGEGFAGKGHEIVFVDINPGVLNKLKEKGYSAYLPHEFLKEDSIDVFFLAVSTPTVGGKIELRYLKSALRDLASGYLKIKEHYCVITVRSTIPPGTEEEVIIPLLEEYSGKRAGEHFGVSVNPEFLREETATKDFQSPWLITIGSIDSRSGETIEGLYGSVDCPVVHISLREAEMQKYIHNLWNACKISFFNEMRTVCGKIGEIDADKIFKLTTQSAEACWNPEYGIKNLGPYRGSCLPKDTVAFLAWAKEKLNYDMPLSKAIIEVNNELEKRQKIKRETVTEIKTWSPSANIGS